MADGDAKLVQDEAKEQMEKAAELRVPLQVDLAVGNSWYEAK